MGLWLHAAVLLSVAFLRASAYDRLEQGNCPYGFLSYTGGRCLHVSVEYVNNPVKPYQWAEARELCRNMTISGWTVDLAFSLDEDVMQQFTKFILNEVTSMRGYVFFVGAERETPSGHWEWVNGQPVDELSYVWNVNLPWYMHETSVKTMLVPSGAFNRFHMIGIKADNYAPSFVCEAAPKCA